MIILTHTCTHKRTHTHKHTPIEREEGRHGVYRSWDKYIKKVWSEDKKYLFYEGDSVAFLLCVYGLETKM